MDTDNHLLLPDVDLSNDADDDAKVFLLHKDDPLSWTILPQVCDRIRLFCEHHSTDTDPEVLCEMLSPHFTAPHPLIDAVVAAWEMKLVGYLLASLDDWYGTKAVTVLQYQHDGGFAGITRDILTKGFAILEDWGRERDADYIQALVQDRKIVIAHKRFHHFKAHSLLMRRSIPKE